MEPREYPLPPEQQIFNGEQLCTALAEGEDLSFLETGATFATRASHVARAACDRWPAYSP